MHLEHVVGLGRAELEVASGTRYALLVLMGTRAEEQKAEYCRSEGGSRYL